MILSFDAVVSTRSLSISVKRFRFNSDPRMPNGSTDGHEGESSPLLESNEQAKDVGNKDSSDKNNNKPMEGGQAKNATDLSDAPKGAQHGRAVDGLLLAQGTVMGQPMGRGQWDSCLFACCGRTDEFWSSDLEVCCLGMVAPCVLYGSNAERLEKPGSGSFSEYCLPYGVACLVTCVLCRSNILAPWFTSPTRRAIRHKFNLEGGCESLGCCGSCLEEDAQREQCELACDFATHLFCHPCAICQEGREVRRRMPHPGFNAKPALVMRPPGEMTMGRKG